MSIKKLSLFVLFILCASTLWGGSATISASQDVYVRRGDNNNHNDATLLVKKDGNGGGGNTRKTIIQFEFQRPPSIDDAALYLDLIDLSGKPSETFYVWGVKDGHAMEDFDETTTGYSDWTSILDNSGDGTNNNTNSLHDGDSSSSGAQALGLLYATDADINHTVSFTSDALIDFMQSDTNGRVTFILTRSSNSSAVSRFAALEHDTLSGPRLFISAPDYVVTANQDSYVRYGNSNVYGTSPDIFVKKSYGGTSGTTRLGIISFNLNANAAIKSAELRLDVSTLNNGTSGTFWVWAVKDKSSLENVNEETTNFHNWESVFDGSWDGIKNHSQDLYNGGNAIAKFTVYSGDLGETVYIGSDKLTNLINDDTNGKITLLLTRYNDDDDLNTGFASKEHPTLNPPALYLRPELEKGTASADMEVILADLDGDNDKEMVLVINNPDGGGFMTADPIVMADYFIKTGYGLGQGTDFFDALSSSQQYSLSNEYFTINANTCIDTYNTSAIASQAIYEAVASLAENREYPISTFTSRVTLEADLSSSGLTLSIGLEPCTLLEIKAGNFTGSIDGPSAQAVLAVSENRLTCGAEYNYFTATVGATSDTGSSASVSYSQGGGIFLDVATGDNGVYGASFPFYGNTQVSLYLSADDAVTAYNAIKNAEASWQGEAKDLIGEEVYNILNLDNVSLISHIDNARRTVMFVESVNDATTIFVRDTGKEALITIQNAGSQTANLTEEALQSMTQSVDNAADELLDFAEDFSSVVSSTWSDVTGWVEGTISDIGQGILNFFGF